MMKKILFIGLALLFSMGAKNVKAQEIYPITSGEMLFQFADIEKVGVSVNAATRFTVFFHLGQYLHVDLNDNIGLYTGLAIRNVGFIYDTPSPALKTIRRSYTLGVPLALKLGSFSKHLYVFGGGEYEMLFHYKAKQWNSTDRGGTKSKYDVWFTDRTELFVPSVFVGLQFPRGLNVKMKYYMGDFLNMSWTGEEFGQTVSYSDYTKLDMFYLSVCWQFRTDKIKEYWDDPGKVALY